MESAAFISFHRKGLDQTKGERGLSIVHIRRGWMSSARGRGYEEEKETDDDDDDWGLSKENDNKIT